MFLIVYFIVTAFITGRTQIKYSIYFILPCPYDCLAVNKKNTKKEIAIRLFRGAFHAKINYIRIHAIQSTKKYNLRFPIENYPISSVVTEFVRFYWTGRKLRFKIF